ncbi:MAG: EAL domain-containing protein, partial [Acidobacteriota bacterium]
MSTHLETILAPGALRPVFQAIVDGVAGGTPVFAYEGLIRGPASTNFEQPDVLFGYVRRRRCEERVDLACVRSILAAAPLLPSTASISLNVHAATLGRVRELGDLVVAAAEENGIAPHRIIMEIVEHGSAWSAPHFLAGIARLRQLGLRIALDDVGAGLSNYRMILDTCPDFFKIDRYLVTGCSDDGDRRKVLTSIRDLAAAFGAQAIAEGVETEEEWRTLADLGIRLMQGFLFARP